MSLKSVAEDYFSKLNSIAARLHTDLEETKSSYDKLWATLSEKDQQEILSESIIKPEISIRYDSKKECSTQMDYAVKLVFDDHCSYRDEHSAPFSFKTQSQRDLSIFHSDKPKALQNKTKSSKSISKIPITFQDIDFSQKQGVQEDSSNILPKTGLDFLDNW
ncbi:hypothetical protein NQ315_004821 [Exocentrus adspersus]|uniref:DUF4706 domain-containing protein n=1 Tax=Exocentrus adspersus TaxID=1586481 RepID=A0AAV8W314_9CUCU|nr:hypothetical protein NQ315_004821 [Exocentrus adspersus]